MRTSPVGARTHAPARIDNGPPPPQRLVGARIHAPARIDNRPPPKKPKTVILCRRDKHRLSAFAKQTIARRAIKPRVERDLPPANCIRSECRTSNACPYARFGTAAWGQAALRLLLPNPDCLVGTPPHLPRCARHLPPEGGRLCRSPVSDCLMPAAYCLISPSPVACSCGHALASRRALSRLASVTEESVSSLRPHSFSSRSTIRPQVFAALAQSPMIS